MSHNQSEIANLIDVHKSTISQELWRYCGIRGYQSQQAHRMAISPRKKSVDRVQLETWKEIDHRLHNDWSPEQVSGCLKSRKYLRVSHEWIYQHILADKRNSGDLYCHLRCQQKRRKRYGSYDCRVILPNRVSVEQRPYEVDTRQRLGYWEVDTIIGKRHKQAIVTLIERKSRLVLLSKVQERSAGAVKEAITHLLEPWSNDVHTITADNGKGFAHYEDVSRILKTDFYFVHPNAAWQRGSNENANGLVRQYIPKRQSFDEITQAEIERVICLLINRPRKCLVFCHLLRYSYSTLLQLIIEPKKIIKMKPNIYLIKLRNICNNPKSTNIDIIEAIEDVLVWLNKTNNNTDINCRKIDYFVATEIISKQETVWLPDEIKEILFDMGGALHDTHTNPEIASNFESMPKQLLKRIQKLKSV